METLTDANTAIDTTIINYVGDAALLCGLVAQKSSVKLAADKQAWAVCVAVKISLQLCLRPTLQQSHHVLFLFVFSAQIIAPDHLPIKAGDTFFKTCIVLK